MGHCILDEYQAREVLRYLYRKYGSVRKLSEKLGVSKTTLHRWLKEGHIPASGRIKLCMLIDEDELLHLLKGPQFLKRYGLLDENGKLNKALVLALIDSAMQVETIKEEVLGYLLKYYKQEIMERLSETLPKIELHWSNDFEKWLTEKKSKPISERTLRDYRNIWYRCLEGKILGWHLLRQLEAKKMLCHDNQYHPTGWLRQVFRHYIKYLYTRGKLDWDTYSRLMLTIPGRRYGRKLKQKPIHLEDVINTLKILREKRRDIYTLYLLILYSGIRFTHVLNALKNWNPQEELYIEYLNRNIYRLTCRAEHCRYYLGLETGRKPAAFMFFPKTLLQDILDIIDELPGQRRIGKIVKKLGCLPPKYIRVFALREMKKVLGDNDTFRFIVGKFGELSTTARHYMDLLQEADSVYPDYIHHIQQLFEV